MFTNAFRSQSQPTDAPVGKAQRSWCVELSMEPCTLGRPHKSRCAANVSGGGRMSPGATQVRHANFPR